jgi:hypothetical protein
MGSRRAGRPGLLLTLALALSVMALPGADAAATAGDRAPADESTGGAGDVEDGLAWRTVLERAAVAARQVSYAGEVIWVTRTGDTQHVVTADVRNDPVEMVVGDPADVTLRLGADGGWLTASSQGWFLPLPPVEPARDDLERMITKYEIAVAGTDWIADRPCTIVEVHRRGDGLLRERLWVDDDTGLLMRRETYEGGEQPVRMVAYLSLDLHTRRAPSPAARAGRVGLDRGLLAEREQGITAIDEQGLSALREAGWVVPDALPGGFAPLGAYAVASAESQPLQLVYGDGLYVVSVFQQTGHPDWSTLPPGAERVESLAGKAYEWPGAVPSRIVWEAEGRTWSLVGDPPPQELLALAAALPQASDPGLWQRLRRGLGRLWSMVSP